MNYTDTAPSPRLPKGFFVRLLIAALFFGLPLLALLSLVGCESTDARRAGQHSALVAALAFDGPNDAAVFEKAKLRIDAFLATGQPVSSPVVDLFTDWLAAELGRNPAAVRLVVSRLKDWIDSPQEFPLGQLDPAREFLAGVSDTLGIAFPQ